MKGRLLLDRGCRGAENMARDEALLAVREPAWDLTLRLYDWVPPAVSLGYFQTPSEVLDEAELKAEGFHWVRRETGGGAIFHNDEVTFSLSCAEEPEILPFNRARSYEAVNDALKRALLLSGLQASKFSEGRRGPDDRNNLCFLTSTAYDVLYEGRKIAGSAQRRKNGRVLHHGSLFLSRDAALYAKIFKWSGAGGIGDAVRSKTITAAEALGAGLSFNRAAAFIVGGFEEVFGTRFEKSSFSPSEEEAALTCLGKYDSLCWNAERRVI